MGKPLALIMLLMLSWLCGCNHSIRNNTLKEIQANLDDLSLTEAKASEIYNKLSDINADSLNDGERNLLAFLTIKAADKAYITHTNDTAYLKIKDYFKDHNTGLYPEVLYYGGRVYSDIGDYPTALQYFHEALEKLPNNNLQVRARILSQRGQILSNINIRLYNEALQSFLEAIKIQEGLKDSLSLMYNYSDLGTTYMHIKAYNIAFKYFKKSQSIAQKISPENLYDNTDYIAFIYYLKGLNNKAMEQIRLAISKGDSINWPTAKSYAINIYLKAGIKDTAFYYAKEIATRKDFYNREYGYEMMLSPYLISYIDPDSLSVYFSDYKNLLDKYFDRNQNQAALTQNASYNYTLHERKRKEAEEKSIKLQRTIAQVLIILLVVIILIFYQKNRNKKNLLQLHKALENIENLKKIIKENNPGKINLNDGDNTNLKVEQQKKTNCNEINDLSKICDETEELRKNLQKELNELRKSNSDPYHIPLSILNSDSYNEIQEKLQCNKVIGQDSTLWKRIENDVLVSSPQFKQHLLLMTRGHLKTADYQMALLIKCGMNPTQLSILIGRGKSTISYRREKLCLAMFGEKMETKTIDFIIHLL